MIAGQLSRSLFQQAVRFGATRAHTRSVIRTSRGWDENVIELFLVTLDKPYDDPHTRAPTCHIKHTSVRPPPAPHCRPRVRRRRTP